MKLSTLKPRVGALNTLRTAALSTRAQRMIGRALQRRNRAFLLEHPLCAECERQGFVRAALEVDHIMPLHLGGHDGEPNLQGLCIEHHRAKSAREAAARAGS